jgi:hypothetical protein
VRKDTIFRHRGEHGLFYDVTLLGKGNGCWLDDCTYTDKFAAASFAECGAACASVPECQFWSFGEEAEQYKCWLRVSSLGEDSAVGALSGEKSCAPPEYPRCIEQGAILRAAGAFAIFIDATRYGKTRGCKDDDCEITDKFAVQHYDECARVCRKEAECEFWTHGTEEGVEKCWLRKGDGGKEYVSGYIAGSKYCGPVDGDEATIRMDQGNPECWVSGFSYELCCSQHYGDEGNEICWDGFFTFSHCCKAPAAS